MKRTKIANASGLAIVVGDKEADQIVEVSYTAYRGNSTEKGKVVVKNNTTSATAFTSYNGDDCGLTFTAGVTTRNLVLRLSISDATYDVILEYKIN